MRAEIAELREQLAAPPATAAPRRPTHRGLALRRFIAGFLVALAAFGTVASGIGLWADRTAFNTDRWVATVGPLPGNPEIDAAMATYLTDEIFSSLNVQERLKTALPAEAAFLAGPVTSAVRDYLKSTVQKFMATEQFRTLWESTNRFAHAQIVAVLEGRSKTVYVQGGKVTLDLLPVVNNLLVSLEKELPTMFGKQLQLPTLTSGEIPAGLRTKVEQALNVTLPSNFAQIELFESDRLTALQRAVVIFQRSVKLLVAGTIVAFLCALWAAPKRRRTLLQFGIWLVVATVALTSVLRVVQGQLLDQIPVQLYRDAAAVAMKEVFSTLRQEGTLLLVLGILIAAVAYLVGPGRGAVAVRRHTVRGARAAWSHTATTTVSVARSGSLQRFSATYADGLRVGGVLLALIVALLLSSWTGLIVVAVLLGLFELAVTLLARQGGGGPPRAAPA